MSWYEYQSIVDCAGVVRELLSVAMGGGDVESVLGTILYTHLERAFCNVVNNAEG